MPSDWQDIATAPKDGTRVLLSRPDGIVIGFWNSERFAQKPKPFWARDIFFSKTLERNNQPSHWMPLPEPPLT